MLAILGFVIMGIGFLISMIFGIILMVKAFQTSVGWGLAYIFGCGIGAIIFIVKFWDIAKGPFLKSLAGGVIGSIGAAIAIPSLAAKAVEEGMLPTPPAQSAPAQP